jgi:hypothetical protein
MQASQEILQLLQHHGFKQAIEEDQLAIISTPAAAADSAVQQQQQQQQLTGPDMLNPALLPLLQRSVLVCGSTAHAVHMHCHCSVLRVSTAVAYRMMLLASRG